MPNPIEGSFQDNSTQDRRAETQRSSMFFGSSSPFQDPEQAQRQHIQILQADANYEREKELKVSSLEGLRYLDKQYQILSSKYPGRLIQIDHMVSFNLRESVIGSYNTFLYEESKFTGLPVDEILSQNWLQHTKVSDILLEAARPCTIEIYSIELRHSQVGTAVCSFPGNAPNIFLLYEDEPLSGGYH